MKSDLVEQSAKGVPAVAGAATAILTVNQWLGFLTVIPPVRGVTPAVAQFSFTLRF